ncbi:MAG: hypothetical protein IJT27_00025 [Clostridia bacterium]|nr:hypothetical protein [Clostridia bacterium]
MTVSLPFDEHVPLRSFSHYFAYLGILQGQGVNVNYFLFNHFITLNYCSLDGFISFWEERKLYRLFDRKKFFFDLPDPVSFAKEQLRNKKYVLIDLNHQYVSASAQTECFVHEFLLYGYDDDTQCFSAIGYVSDDSLTCFSLRNFQLPFSEVAQGYATTGLKKKRIHKNYVISVKKTPAQKLNVPKLRLDVFIYRHFPQLRLAVWFLNQNAFSAARKTILRHQTNKIYSLDLRFLKTLEGRALILLSLAQVLSAPPETTEKCEKLRKLFSAALRYGALSNARSGRPERYYVKVLTTLADNLEEAKRLEKSIFDDFNKCLKGM